MRITHLFTAAVVLGMAACTNANDNSAPSGDSTKAAASHDSMHHGMDSSQGGITPLPEVPAGAKVYFKNLKDGATVKSPFKVEMGIEGLKIDTAGPITAASGHHHLLIDAGDSIPSGNVIPKDEHHIHFGKGQTSTEVTLPPGKHVLTLQVADGIHRSYGGKLASTITVTVQ